MNKYFNTKSIEQPNDRDILQNNFDRAFSEMDKDRLRLHYQNLRNLELNIEDSTVGESICLSALVESLTIACDIICAENEISFIYCGNDTSLVNGNIKSISKAILNLLSNAFLYGKGRLITVKTIEKTSYISIEIQSEGVLPKDFAFGKGLSFVQKTCHTLDGYFFIESTNISVKTIMILPKSKNYKHIATVPHFCELLSDRLSPVYTEFFGMQ